MNSIFYLGLVGTAYGILGIFGVQIIPEKYKGKAWTRQYKRVYGVSRMMLGVPWCILGLALSGSTLGIAAKLWLMLLCALPGILYGTGMERRYEAKLKAEQP